MLKKLRTLALAALMILPFATQAQTDCTGLTIPYAENFDSYSGNATSSTAPSGYPAITLPDCWSFLNMSESTSSYPQVFLSSITTYAESGNCLFFKSSSTTPIYAIMPAITNSSALQLTFTYRNEGVSASNGTIIVGVMTDATDETTFTALETCPQTTTKTVFEVNIPAGTLSAGARVAFKYQGGSSNNYYAAIDNVTLELAPTCIKVTNLAIDATQTTINSITLTWTDANNTGATYIVYNMADTSVVATGITGTSYTVTGLTANTPYTFAVMTDCGGGDHSALSLPISGRTACSATTALPFSEDFSGYTGLPSTPYYGPAVTPACWDYYSNGTNTAETSGSSSYYGGVVQYNGTSSYASMVTNDPYLLMPIYIVGSAVTSSTYIGYGEARGNIKIAILPAFAEALNTLQISFDYKMSSAYSATAAATTLELGYVMGNDLVFTSMQSWNSVTTTQHILDLNLSTLAANAPAGARLAFKFSGVHNGTSTSSYSTVYCGIDNVVVQTLPSCVRVTNLTASNITSGSVTLTWNDANSGATYTVSDASGVIASGITNPTYTVTGLAANTEYTFSVVANCSASDASEPATVTARTNCAAYAMPFSETFDASLSSDYCWRGATGTTADEAIAGTALTLTANSQWTYSSSTSNGLDAGHYRVNIYGTSCKKWMITPEIDLTTATNPLLTFDAAFTVYSSTSTGPATGFETNTSQKFMILATTNGGTTWALVSDISLSSIASGSYIPQYVDLSAYAGQTVRLAFYAQSTVSGGDNNLHVDNIAVSESTGDICYPVTSLAASNITATGATLTWTGDAASYNVYDMSDTSLVSNTTSANYSLTNLAGNTQYTFGVSAVCGSSESDIVTTTFRTSCVAYTLPFSETFDASLSSDPCWRGATGTTADEAIAGTALTLTANSQWTHSSSTSNGIDAGHYRVNIYGSSCKKWMITPEIDLTTATNPLLTFDAAFTVYSGTGPATGFESNTSQKFMILATTNGGTTWALVSDISLSSIASGSYIPQYVDLSAYAGQTVRLAFYAQSTVSGGDNNLHVDNIAVSESTGDICYPVTNLSVIDMTANSATISWNGTSADSYTVTVYDQSNQQVGTPTTLTDTSYVLTGLQMDNDYTVTVVANCGNDASSATTLSIHIGYCLPNPTSVDNDGITNITIGSMTNSTSHPTTSPYYMNNSSMVASVPAGTTATVDITYATGYTYGTIIWVDWNNNMTFEGTEVVYVGTSTNSNPTTLNATFDIPASTTPGNYRMRIAGADSYFDSYTGSISDAATANPCFSSTYAIAEDYTLTVTTAPSCMAVTNLTVDSVTATSIFLSWTDTENSGATYSIYSSNGNVVATGLTTTSYEVTGLTASTSYTFGVIANCSANSSSLVTTITASTDCAGGSCNVTINGIDDYGDGWDGATITVSQNGAILGTFTVNTETNTATYSVCSGTPVTFSWTGSTMSYPYPDEVSFAIIDGGNTTVYTLSDATNTPNGVFFTMNDPCPSCVAPTVTLDSVTTTSAYISWVGNAASYSVYNGTALIANTTATSYTFTGLTNGTAYTFGVIAHCSADDSSSMATVNATTEFDCQDITTLPYNYGFEAGLGCWNSVNGSTDGVDWFTTNCAGLSNVNPHGGNYVASSWSWNNMAMHANAWLISPKFVLPNVATGDSLTFSWWEMANSSYADRYSVVLSTTTNDTTAFTTVLRPYTAAAGSWTQQTVDLTAYAGQSVYVAFHHMDYDMNYLLIDDIELFQGAYVPPAPDTLTVIFAVSDATMGTTTPAPGSYQYLSGDTVYFSATPNFGYRFTGWTLTTSTGATQTLPAAYISAYFPVDNMMSYGTISMIANFEVGNPDSTTITYAVNNPTMGTTIPAPGTHTIYVGNTISAQGVANAGYALTGWVLDIYNSDNVVLQSDTIYSDDPDFANPMVFGNLPQSFADNDYTITITALFDVSNSLSVTLAVNDATMGTTTPAPGTYSYDADQTVMAVAVPNEGYHFVGWVKSANGDSDTMFGMEYIQLSFPASSMIEYGSMTLTALFAEGSGNPDVFTLITNINDRNMGIMTPAPGTYTYVEGDVINFSVSPNEGYHFESVNITVSYMGTIVEEVTYNDLEFTTEPLEIDEEMLGYTMTVTVNFASNEGIEDADNVNIYAYSQNGNIVLKGAEGREVYVFDLNGRTLHHTATANDTEVYNAPVSGAYLIKIDNITKRVVVIK